MMSNDELPLSLTAGGPFDPRPGQRPWEAGPPGDEGHWQRDQGYHLPDDVVPQGDRVLRNVIGAFSQEALDKAEAHLVTRAQHRLWQSPPEATFDRAHLQQIHRRLFGDVYPWAGQNRTVPIARGATGSAAPSEFMPPEQLDESLDLWAGALHAEHCLQDMGQEHFIDRLGDMYAALNYIHPFREGNGRTQREFFTQLAAAAGYALDWSVGFTAGQEQAQHNEWSKLAHLGNREPLKAWLSQVVQPGA